MADKTTIEWTDATWNPTRGCSRVSTGCGGANHQGGCYAEKIAARFSAPGMAFHGFAERTEHGGRWTGKVALVGHNLGLPLSWRKPRCIFVNSTSDLFHEALTDEDIAEVMGVAVAAVHLRGHVLQILTKRSGRMRETLGKEDFWDMVNACAESHVLERVDPHARRKDDARATLRDYGPSEPPPGIWLGVSTEDQDTADLRIPDLLATPAAVRWISAEPLLGPLDLGDLTEGAESLNALTGLRDNAHGKTFNGTKLDWVVTGGESGPNARPAHPDWFRSLRDQCAAAGIPYFHKQNGAWKPGHSSDERDIALFRDGTFRAATWLQGATDDERNGVERMCLVGKKLAGALLDGIEHRAMPS